MAGAVTILCSLVVLATFHTLILKATSLDQALSPSAIEESTSFDESDFTSHPNFHLLPTLDQCGYRFVNTTISTQHNRVKRIIQGVPTHSGSMPWMVQIFLINVTTNQQTFSCGGSLINENTVLTAAHCVTGIYHGYALTDVVLGAYYLEEKSFNNYNSKRVNYTIKGFNYSAEIFLVEIESIKVHENYTKRIVKNDIALIKLKQNISSLVITKIPLNNESESSEPLSINKIDLNTIEIIRPICLPRSHAILDTLVGQNFQLAGWGRIKGYADEDDNITKATQMNMINSAVQPLDYCQDFYGNFYGPLDNTTLCVLGAPGEDNCHGDSGSPLIKAIESLELDGIKQVFQFGIVSTALSDCGRQGAPTLFTNVVQFMPWILDNL